MAFAASAHPEYVLELKDSINLSTLHFIVEKELLTNNMIDSLTIKSDCVRFVRSVTQHVCGVVNKAAFVRPDKRKKKRKMPDSVSDYASTIGDDDSEVLTLQEYATAKDGVHTLQEAISWCKTNMLVAKNLGFGLQDGDIWFYHNVVYERNNNFGIGRFYPRINKGDITPLVYCSKVLRNLALGKRTSEFITVEPTAIEVDQSSSHQAIILALLDHLIQNVHDPSELMELRAPFVALVRNKQQVREQLASCFNHVPGMLKLHKIKAAFPGLLTDKTIRVVAQKMVDEGLMQHVPCTPELAKRAINCTMYGMKYENMCDELQIYSLKSVPEFLKEVADALKRLPSILKEKADALKGSLFEVSYKLCEHVAATKKNRQQQNPMSALSLYLQTVETRITMTAMQIYTEEILMYSYDGFLVSKSDIPLGFTAAVLSDELNRKLLKPAGCFTFDLKTPDPLVLGEAPFVAREQDEAMELLWRIVKATTAAHHELDTTFVEGLDNALCRLDLDPATSELGKEIVACYFGKFVMHNRTQGNYFFIIWDHAFPHHVAHYSDFRPTVHKDIQHKMKRVSSSKEVYWTNILVDYLPQFIKFAHLGNLLEGDDHNKIYNFAKLEKFTFDLRRHPRIVRLYKESIDQHGLEFENSLELGEVLPVLSLAWLLCGFEVDVFVFLMRIMALRVLDPHVLIPISIQASSREHGTGKNLFFETLFCGKLLGDQTSRLTGNADMFADVMTITVHDPSLIGGAFNEHEEGVSLFICNECSHPSNHVKAAQFKGKITDAVQHVNAKFQPLRSNYNKCMFIFLTNALNSLPVEHSNRRYFCIRVEDDSCKFPIDEYTLLAKMIENDNWCFVFYKFLHTLKPRYRNVATLQDEMPNSEHTKLIKKMSSDGALEFAQVLWSDSRVIKAIAHQNNMTKELARQQVPPAWISKAVIRDFFLKLPGTKMHEKTMMEQLVSLGALYKASKRCLQWSDTDKQEQLVMGNPTTALELSAVFKLLTPEPDTTSTQLSVDPDQMNLLLMLEERKIQRKVQESNFYFKALPELAEVFNIDLDAIPLHDMYSADRDKDCIKPSYLYSFCNDPIIE